ncbi:hypothetical protein [Nostoc parmelioides]|uniref:PEP-CTERM sorting domain-containing protein n=1 Tax=Nostoc parmelioides FACHB-3921 TaxID=2692909 RepID=A0ABR8B7W8_9NOSO|nr:hypothetical protein [Nostoc parmelioides]MBD2249951.1 hypothetical protein [Nostoc parmelioides FACHB-3921]
MNFSEIKKILAAMSVISSMLLITNNSAVAQINGSSYSRGSNVPDMSFDLIFRKSNGTTIPDSSIGNTSGLFVGAIQNFSYLGHPVPNPSGIASLSFNFTNANLSTTLIGTNVKYTIIATQPFELIDSIAGSSTTINPNPVFTFGVDVSSFSPETKIKAVNNLQYITENNLFALSSLESQSFSMKTFNGINLGIATGDLVVTDISSPPSQGFILNNNLVARSNLFQGVAISASSNRNIPESNVNIGLLIFGLFGTTTILRRKFQQS